MRRSKVGIRSRAVRLEAMPISPRMVVAGVTLHAEASESFRFPNTSRLYAYWNQQRGGRPRPQWGDINLMDVYDVAPYICVRDVIPGSDDLVCRYWGTRLTELYGVDCTGKKISETYSAEGASNTLSIYRRTLASERPLRLVGNLGYVGRSERRFFEAIFLRLDGTDQPDRHVIGAFQFDCVLSDADRRKLEGLDAF